MFFTILSQGDALGFHLVGLWPGIAECVSRSEMSTLLPFAPPRYGMSGLKVEVGPVVLDPGGGIVEVMEPAWCLFRRAVGRQPSELVRPRHRNRTRRVFVIALPLAMLVRQIQKPVVAIGIRESG